MKIAMIIPAHNEENVISATIENIINKLNLDFEIIIVDDHSTDNTAAIVKELIRRNSSIRLVFNDLGRGFGDALRKGFSVANSDLVIPIMADQCDDPLTIQKMHEQVCSGYDVVCGSRYMSGGKKLGGPVLQSVFSRFVGRSLKYLVGIPTHDVSNSFKCYRINVLDAITIQSKGFEISMEIALRAYFAGFKITEVPTSWQGRVMGRSKFYLFKVAPDYFRLYLWAISSKKRRDSWQM